MSRVNDILSTLTEEEEQELFETILIGKAYDALRDMREQYKTIPDREFDDIADRIVNACIINDINGSGLPEETIGAMLREAYEDNLNDLTVSSPNTI